MIKEGLWWLAKQPLVWLALGLVCSLVLKSPILLVLDVIAILIYAVVKYG